MVNDSSAGAHANDAVRLDMSLDEAQLLEALVARYLAKVENEPRGERWLEASDAEQLRQIDARLSRLIQESAPASGAV